MVGKEKDIAIMVNASINGIKIVSDMKPRIIPSSEKVDDFPYHYRGNKFFGRIEEVNVKDIWHAPFGYDMLIRVNVGVCDILTNPDSDTFKKVKVGDFIELNGLTDLLDVR